MHPYFIFILFLYLFFFFFFDFTWVALLVGKITGDGTGMLHVTARTILNATKVTQPASSVYVYASAPAYFASTLTVAPSAPFTIYGKLCNVQTINVLSGYVL